MENSSINWQAVGVLLTVAGALIGAGIIYLKMFIDNKVGAMESKLTGAITQMRQDILTNIESKFSQKEIVQITIDDHNRRLNRIESKMETIRLSKEADDRR